MSENERQSNLRPRVYKQTAGLQLLYSFYQFFRVSEHHEQNNSIFAKIAKQISDATELWLETSQSQSVSFRISNDHIYLNDMRLRVKSRFLGAFSYFIRFLSDRGLSGFSVNSVSSPDRLQTFLSLLMKKGENPSEFATTVAHELKKAGLREFDLDATHLNLISESSEIELRAVILHRELLHFADVCFAKDELGLTTLQKGPEELLSELTQTSEDPLFQLLCLLSPKKLQRFENRWSHLAVNSCILVNLWARALGLPTGVVLELSGAALALPFTLYKQSESQPVPYDNPLVSLRLFLIGQSVASVWQLTDLQLLCILESQIPFFDGTFDYSKYSCRLHFFSRMLRIVFRFQDLTTFKTDRGFLLPDEALNELLHPNEGCDPVLTKLFINWIGVYPQGSLVMLDSGEIAQIYYGSSDPIQGKRPIVNILTNKERVPLKQPYLFNLMDVDARLGMYKRSIRQALSFEEIDIPPQILGRIPLPLPRSLANMI